MKHIFSNSNESAVARNSYRCATLALPLRKVFFTLSLLFTLSVGQMWAEAFWPYAGFYEVYMTYSYSGNNSNYTFYASDNNSSQSVDLGTLTADFKVNSLYLKCYKNTGDWSKYGNLCGGLMIYNTGSGDNEYQPTWTWTDKNTWSNDYQAHLWEISKTSCNKVIASYNSGASGSYTAKLAFKMWGSDDNGSDCGDIWWISNNSNNYKFKYKIAPPAVKSGTLSVSATNVVSGTGTEGDPFVITYGSTTQFTVSGTQDHTDANSSIKGGFGTSTISSSATSSAYTPTTSAQSLTIYGAYVNSTTSSLKGASSNKTIYYKWADPAVPTLSMSSVSPTTLVEGNTVTINVARANSSAAISYEYKIGDGSWTSLTPASTSNDGQTATWAIPEAHGATRTFYFRATMSDGGTKTTAASDPVTVYGKKTIHVRNINDWSNFYVYRYNSDSDKEANWHGSTTGVSTLAGQWKDVVMTSQWEYFIINDNGSNQIKGDNTYTYTSSISNGGYYTIQEGTGTSLTLTSTTAPAAPTATTNDANEITSTTAKFNYSVNANRDKTTPGIAFKQSDDDIDAATIYSSGTKVAGSATNGNASGSTAAQTITPGKKYYYVAYGTNGFGTSYGTVKSFVAPYKVTITKPTGCSAITPDAGTQYVHIGDEISSTAATGYTFSSWSLSKVTLSSPTTTTGVTTSTITAISADNGAIQPVYTENMTTVNLIASPVGKGTFTSGGTVTSVSAGVDTHPTVTAVPATGYRLTGTIWSESSDYISITPANAAATTITATGTTGNTANLTATFTPITYTVKFNGNGGTGSMSNQTLTYDAAQTLTSNAFTRTGYTFAGWATAADGSVAYTDGQSVSNLSSTQGATVDLYAKWTAKTYTVTLDVDEDHKGTIAGAATSQTVTYDATPTTIANRPTAEEGYGLDGYYTGHNGTGTKLINGDGTWVASVAGYTDASSHWIHDGDETLYAYYKKAEITVGLAAGVVAPWTEESPSTVTATPTISPTPAGNTKICWFLLQNNNNPVEPQPTFTPGEGNSVSFRAPTVSGNYKVVATLRTGTSCDGGTLLDADTVIFTVAGEHTVTILYKCGDDVIKASTTSPGKPLEGTSITAPNIIGYSFHHWVLGDGVTLASGTAGSAGSAGTATISYTAIYDGQITAVYTKKNMIYFNNTLGWSDVYVYFYNSDKYWSDTYGTGAMQGQEFKNGDDDHHKPYWEQEHGHMTRIEGTNIWYFDYTGAGYTTRTNVVFTEGNQHNKQWFWKTKVVRRGDHKSALPMFVPLTNKSYTKNDCDYYNEGYWMNYPENTGYVLKIYDSKTYGTSDEMQSIPFEFTADKTMPMSLTVELNANREYGFEIHRADGSSYGNNTKVMKINDSGDNGSPWSATSGKRTGLKTSVAGEYIFTLSFGNNGGYNYLVGVHYPVATNDYRIVYNDRVKWSHSTAHNADAPWHHPSRAIHKEDGAKDTVSFYVSKAAGASASMKFQYASAISNEGVVTWSDVASGSIDLSSIENSGVYNFILTQSAGSISVEKIEPYTGAYYIRTDCAGSTKWDNYRAADHQMTYSEFSKSRETNKFGDLFSHYFTKWCPRGTNIKFCIANDYSSCVSDTLIQDDAFPGDVSSFPENVDANGTLKNHGESDEASDPYSANIRFMYDESTNRIKRAYVAAATNVSKKFLVLQGDDKLKDKDGNAIAEAYLETNAVLFQDDQNWIYETTVKAIPGARVRIYAMYLVGVEGTGQQFFVGASGDWADERTIELLGGSGSTPMLVRVIYDFKTNRLVCAWMPDGTEIEGEHAINADIMVIREHQDAAQTITFKNDKSKLSEVKTVYGAMKFNRWILNNRQHPEDINPDHCRAANIESDLSTYHRVLPPAEQKSIYERSLYFISFPFRVKLSEVFGFGKYWDEWYIEYYDGETRAKNGYWKDSPPNWKYVTTDMLNSFYLEPNVGYILGLDLDYMQAENTTFWANGISNVELYFPSQESIETIGRTAVKMPALGDAYLCTINRGTSEGDRRVKDSYWRCIGVPGYSSYNNTLTVDGSNEFSWQTNTVWREDFKDYPFLYEWNMTDNTLTAQSTNRYNFKAMHAYLVQNGNEIHWSAISATPVSPIVARNRAASQTEYLWRLTMECDGQEEDQAFIRMTDEEAVTDGFDFGQDLVKEYNYQRSDLYTYIGYERAAANSMPLHTEETTSIPVGVSIEKGGEYTFAMPDGTSGVGITLIDSETGAQTNLSAGFTYTVNFEKGDYNNRLYLEISPVSQISTGVDEVPSDHVQGTKARKVVIDGLLYIVKDGQMYDATGKHCK